MGEVSKLSATSGESRMDGDVRLVNDVEGGADASGSRMISFGDMVPTLVDGVFTLVNCGEEKTASKCASWASSSPKLEGMSNRLFIS